MTIIDITKDYLELFVAKKDIEELLKAIKNKEVINYSKTFSTHHNIDSFDENSEKFINLLNYLVTLK